MGCRKSIKDHQAQKTIWGTQFTVSPIPITIWSKKRIKRDESEFVYVKGGFPQIISEEQYERCNAIRRSRTKRLTDEKGRTRSFGIQQAQNVWGRKNEVSLWFSHASTSLENQ